MKARVKREGSLRISVPFEEAMKLALKVKPPAEGWKAHEQKAKPKARKSKGH